MAWFRGVKEAKAGVPPAETGVLVVNLGTPTAPNYWPIRRYLAQFLGDRRVVEACPAYWYPILFGPILTFRPLRTAKLYRKIWMPEGSPLYVYSQRLTDALQAQYEPERVRVELAMTYGEPSIEAAMLHMQSAGVRRLIVLPLYPQYSGSTSGAVFDAVGRALRRLRRVPETVFIAEYWDQPTYIDALAASVRAAWDAQGGRSHLVCSYHGIPTKYVEQGDPYKAHVEGTTRLLAAALGLQADEWSQTYQSRFGPATWLQPYTDDLLTELARTGKTRVTVVTPSFPVDCLETLEEIGVESRRKFLEAGGEQFTLVPALNESAEHVASLCELLASYGVEPAGAGVENDRLAPAATG
jgi:protoporphyrin/coproporphyrin ferrochelatase